MQDPNRGLSRDPDFLRADHDRFQDGLADLACDLALDGADATATTLAERVIVTLDGRRPTAPARSDLSPAGQKAPGTGHAFAGKDARMIGRLKTVVLDAADLHAEAQFWSAVLGIPIVHERDDWTTLEGRGVRLAVQLAPDYVPPRWPDPAHPQQLHLDVQVDDPDDAEGQVLALGARRLPDPADAEDFRVFADPAGHPFCLVFDS
jgi:hypothetical protein